jgi:hypothetical protein
MTTVSLGSVRVSLLQAPRIIEGLIASAPRDALTWHEAEGAWTCLEVLCHLADAEITDWMPRVERSSTAAEHSRRSIAARAVLYAIADGRLTHWWGVRPAGWRANVEKLDAFALTPDHLQLRGEHPSSGR